MDPFLRAYFSIDKDHSESIAQRELQDYVRENKLNWSMISRWNTLFDKNHSGFISLQEFCTALGLSITDVRRRRDGGSLGCHADSQVITTTLPPGLQRAVLDYLRHILKCDKFDEACVTKDLKQFLDDRFERMWQVVISRSSLWSSFSYEPHTSFFFYFRKHIFLLWKNSD